MGLLEEISWWSVKRVETARSCINGVRGRLGSGHDGLAG
jgi:hypothetical protein